MVTILIFFPHPFTEEEEYSSEEFDNNIIENPDQDSAVENPQGLCREFKMSRGSGMGSLTRRR